MLSFYYLNFKIINIRKYLQNILTTGPRLVKSIPYNDTNPKTTKISVLKVSSAYYVCCTIDLGVKVNGTDSDEKRHVAASHQSIYTIHQMKVCWLMMP